MPNAHEDPEKVGALDAHFDEFEPGPLPPQVTAPPHITIPAMPLVPPLKTPPHTPENNWCLRGPCRHYLVIKSMAPVDNSASGYIPEQFDRYCRAIPGVMLEMGGELVFECSDWAPLQKDQALEGQRKTFMKQHASCGEADAARKIERENAIAKMQAEADAYRVTEAAKIAAAEETAKQNINANEWAGTPVAVTDDELPPGKV